MSDFFNLILPDGNTTVETFRILGNLCLVAANTGSGRISRLDPRLFQPCRISLAVSCEMEGVLTYVHTYVLLDCANATISRLPPASSSLLSSRSPLVMSSETAAAATRQILCIQWRNILSIPVMPRESQKPTPRSQKISGLPKTPLYGTGSALGLKLSEGLSGKMRSKVG